MAKGWSRRFDDPIPLPDGIELSTLREAVAYLARTVPKAEQAMPEVLTAAETLTHAAEREVDLLWMEGSETRQDRVLRFRQRLRS